jgi:hypothetical protein
MEYRQHPRVKATPPARVRFKLGEQIHQSIPIANIGIRGCCLHASMPLADLLAAHPLLKDWQLKGAGLPARSISARVIWVGQGDGGSDFRAGVQFQDTPVGYTNAIFRYVTMRFHSISPAVRGVDPG